MIKVKNLVKSYKPDPPVLNGVSFTAKKGELLIIVGGSGSGKTTLFRCLTLKQNWNQGTYTYNGKKMKPSSLSARWIVNREFAFLKEKHGFDLQTTPLKIVLAGRRKQFPLWRKFMRITAADEHIAAMDDLDQVGLLDKAAQTIKKLSGGELQRVAIARSLAQGAKVIVADDPIAGLDPRLADQVLVSLKSICNRGGVTVICVLQQLELAQKYADHLIGIADGIVAADVSGRRLTEEERQRIFP